MIVGSGGSIITSDGASWSISPVETTRVISMIDEIAAAFDMFITCDHAVNMSKMIQVRNVPDQLHRKLKVKAAEQGVSLSDFILAELRKLAEQVSLQELAERSMKIVREDLSPSPAELIRAERDRRSS